MTPDWKDLMIAFLHDPPDKARSIRGHERRAARLAAIALDEEVTVAKLHGDTRTEDIMAAVAERVPMPTAGRNGERAVSPNADGRLTVFHPLSGVGRDCDTSRLDEDSMEETLRRVLEGLEDPRHRFLSVWRLYREELVKSASDWALMPAETRQPDHSIFTHMEISAGLRFALSGAHGAAFLSFAVGPVQPFISSARSVRDLWTGSYLLSWITFCGMLPVLQACGPTAFVFPVLRGVPLMDRWLKKNGLENFLSSPSTDKLISPCLPNKFLAVVPNGDHNADSQALAKACRDSAIDGWKEISEAVRTELSSHWDSEYPGWDILWSDQAESFFDVKTSVMPWRECNEALLGKLLSTQKDFKFAFPDAEKVRGMVRCIPAEERPGYDQNQAGLWAARVALSARSLEATRGVRHFPNSTTQTQVPPKCTLLGTFEQMGPSSLEDSKRFWDKAVLRTTIRGTRIREGERLSAVALIKRFAWPAFIAPRLEIEESHRRFPDTATIAATEWLTEKPDLKPEDIWNRHRSWNGQWIHWVRRDQDPHEPVPNAAWERIVEKRRLCRPPTYYAVLVMDGDHIGRWLNGRKSPIVRDILHRTIHEYYKCHGAGDLLESTRPVGPALHSAISEALSAFSLEFAPKILSQHHGELIYAGGDDLLALLPVSNALSCARQLREVFSADWKKNDSGTEHILMGSKATMSAGLAIVHYKEDLRFALEKAREAESKAKKGGRNRLALTICKRSGEHQTTVLKWDFTQTVENWVKAFLSGCSDGWIYRMRECAQVFQSLPLDAQELELRRVIQRSEGGLGAVSAEAFAADFKRFCEKNALPKTMILSSFLGLCQAAAFLSRGREKR